MEDRDERLRQEERSLQQLRYLVDFTEAVLKHSNLNMPECLDLIDTTRKAVLQLFPFQEGLFAMIYGQRFRRILFDRFTMPGTEFSRN
jgi:hypothetical protein